MDVMNDLEKGRCLVLPNEYNFLSGELRMGNHSGYLGSALEPWNASAELARAHYVHFSDHPTPKPWRMSMQVVEAEADKLFEQCAAPCVERDLWVSLYRTFREEMEHCK